MKKLLVLFSALILISNLSTAQTEAEKKFRFGLRIAPQPTWLRSLEKKKVEGAGSKFGFGFGLTTEFKLTEVCHFATGIGGDFEGGKQNFLDTTYFGIDGDDNIVAFEDLDTLGSVKNSIYKLESRNLKTTTITIPITLKLITKEVGGMRWFGCFGLNLGYVTKMRSTDAVKVVTEKGVYKNYAAQENTDFNPYKGVLPIRMGLNVGFGGEYRLSGSTSAFASVNYVHQFLNTFIKDTKYYAEKVDITTKKLTDKATLSAYGSAVQINLGIMF